MSLESPEIQEIRRRLLEAGYHLRRSPYMRSLYYVRSPLGDSYTFRRVQGRWRCEPVSPKATEAQAFVILSIALEKGDL